PGAWKEGVAMDDLVNGAVPLCFCRTEFLAAQQKVPAANLPDDFRPHDVQAVARHDPKCRMRCILKVRASAARTMSQRSAYSECTVTGPLMTAIMGTSISSMFSRIFVPSRRILS